MGGKKTSYKLKVKWDGGLAGCYPVLKSTSGGITGVCLKPQQGAGARACSHVAVHVSIKPGLCLRIIAPGRGTTTPLRLWPDWPSRPTVGRLFFALGCRIRLGLVRILSGNVPVSDQRGFTGVRQLYKQQQTPTDTRVMSSPSGHQLDFLICICHKAM